MARRKVPSDRIEVEADGRRSIGETVPAALDATTRIDAACWRLMTDPELAPLLEWWSAQTDRAAFPPGPVDTTRLLMMQGDRERRLAVMSRAERYRTTKAKGE